MTSRKASPTRKLVYIGLGFVAVIVILTAVAGAMGWLGGENEGKSVETATAYNVVSVPLQAVTVRDFSKDESEADSESENTESSIIPEEDLRKVVFIVKDGIAVRQQVETGISDNTHIQILSGIEANDEIVIGSYRTLSRDLEDGDKVKVNNNRLQQLASGG